MTQVPLKILITDSKLLAQGDINEQIEKLQKAGHDIVIDDNLTQYDFITGPNCWLLRPEVSKLFTLAVTNSRKVANADKERLEQVKLAKASKATAKKASGTGKRVRKIKSTTGTLYPDTTGDVTTGEAVLGDSKGSISSDR